MSNVSQAHNLVKLDKSSKPFTNQRLARIIAKKSKDGEYQSLNLTESMCVSIPMIELDTLNDHTETLLPHIVGLIEDAQNQIIKELRIDSGCSMISDEDISIPKCIAYLDAVAKGNRLTSEYLNNWFVETYSDAAIEFIARLCRFDENDENWSEEQVKVIETKSNVLNSMFAGFASSKYSPDIPKCKAMIKFGEFVGVDNMDARMSNLIERVTRIKTEKELELSADALGFE